MSVSDAASVFPSGALMCNLPSSVPPPCPRTINGQRRWLLISYLPLVILSRSSNSRAIFESPSWRIPQLVEELRQHAMLVAT